MKRSLAVPLIAGLALLAGGCSQKKTAPPSAAELLQKTADATQNLGPCTITAGTMIQRPGRDPITATDTIQYNDATHYVDTSQMGADTSMAYADDGTREVSFNPSTKEYAVGDAGDSLPPMLSSLPEIFRSGLQKPKRAATLTAGTVTSSTLNGTPVYEITWAEPLPGLTAPSDTAHITLSVGQDDFLPRRLLEQDEKGRKTEYTAKYEKAGSPFPASALVFNPPAGAKRTGVDYKALGASFEGKPAPDFALSTLDGKSVRLSGLRGKWVLVDFWATWCPPCRASLPFTNEAGETFGQKGLQVLALDQASERETLPMAKDFVARHNYTFTVLRDEKGKTGQAYKVPGIPTSVLIDPNGVIRSYEVGFRSEQHFWDTLAKAGFKA